MTTRSFHIDETANRVRCQLERDHGMSTLEQRHDRKLKTPADLLGLVCAALKSSKESGCSVSEIEIEWQKWPEGALVCIVWEPRLAFIN